MTVADSQARLVIDVDAVVANYSILRHQLGGAECAAVVKADCYGLGQSPIVDRLWQADCRHFFVARVEEGIALRGLLSEAAIYVFDGVPNGVEGDLVRHRLTPVLNSLSQVDRWRHHSLQGQRPLPAVLHADTGMLRLGLTPSEVKALDQDPDRLVGIDVELVMSHLATADEGPSPQSDRQLARFDGIRRRLPMGRASLANSAGVFRGPRFHFDVARPGYALYGGHPAPGDGPNPMQPVVRLEAPILQVRSADAAETVGYGATFTVAEPMTLATLGIGYADGFLRSGSNRGSVVIGGYPAPIVGRISMDLTTVDVSGVPEHLAVEGGWAEVIGSHRTIDMVADDAGTIGYEILTSLGSRYRRRYL